MKKIVEKSNLKSTLQNAPECTIENNRLNERQRSAIEMLVHGKGFVATAKALEVDRSTLFRWRHEAAFTEALEDRRREVWGSTSDRLKDLVHASLEVLAEQLADPYDRCDSVLPVRS